MEKKCASEKWRKALINKENPVVSTTTGFYKVWCARRDLNPRKNGQKH
nr:MAG TPA: hypothetical protein [Caudoviricetes sp.]